MIGKKTNEIAGCAKGEAGRETENGGKANEMASFQFSVSSFQPGNGHEPNPPHPGLLPQGGEGGGCAADESFQFPVSTPSASECASVQPGNGNPPPHVGGYRRKRKFGPPAPRLRRTGKLLLREYQRAVFCDHRTGIVVLHWSRQIGKSYVLAAWAVYRIMTRPGRLVTVLSNSRENGAEFLLKCVEVCRIQGTPHETVMSSPHLEFEDMRMELRIRFRGKVGRIKVLAANPRTARGFSGDLILDEFAFHEDGQAIWEAAEPILASNKDYLCRIASTGNGKRNLFFRMVEGGVESSNDQGQRTKVQGNDECLKPNDEGMSKSQCLMEPIQNEKLKIKNWEAPLPDPPPAPASRGEGDDCEGLVLENARPHPGPLPEEREKGAGAQGGVKSEKQVSAVAGSGGGNGKISEPSDVGCYVKNEEGNPRSHGRGYYKSKAGFWVSRVTRSKAYEMGLEIYDSQTREPITPEQARAQALDKRAYDQNYECSFADEALALLSHELISAAECDDAGEICEQDWSASAWERIRQSTGQLYAGLDVGRKVDMSVLTVLEKLDGIFWVRGMLRMRDMRLPDQESRLQELCRLRQLRLVCIDMTGLGLGLFEYAHRNTQAHRICGINFASSVSATRVIMEEGSRKSMVRVPEALAMELLQAYEDRKIRQPRDWELREDLRKPCRVTTPGGRVSIAAVRDASGHADHFWSIALAIEAAGGVRVPPAFVPLKLRSRQPGILI